MPPLSRRSLLAAGVALAAGSHSLVLRAAETSSPLALARPNVLAPPRLGPARPFSWDRLRNHAAGLAQEDYVEPEPPAPDVVKEIAYDTVQKIKFKPPRALWA